MSRPLGRRASGRYTPGAVATGLVLLVLAMGAGVQEAHREVVPTVATVVRGEAGEEVSAGGTVVEVGQAWAAPTVSQVDSITDEVERVETPARWLVVRVSWTGQREPVPVPEYVWRDAAGVEYAPSDRYGFRYQTAQPGEWWHEDVIFEVPADAAAAGTLRVLPEGADRALPMEIGEVAVPAVDAVEEIELVDTAPGRG